MTFNLTIELGNAAMDDAHGLAEALYRVAEHFEARGYDGDVEGRVRDANGNTVGKWEIG